MSDERFMFELFWYELQCKKNLNRGLYGGSIIGLNEGDTRSLGYGSYEPLTVDIGDIGVPLVAWYSP